MIPKSLDTLAIAPVSRIMPALPVVAIGDSLQELAARANQFAVGHEYLAKVLSRVDENTVNVRIDNAMFRMKLGAEIQPGQTLTLKYLDSEPNPTFLFSGIPLPASTTDTAALSKAGQMIAQYLQQSESPAPGAPVYQTNTVLSYSPQNAQMLASELHHAITYSGLFYESHLADYAEGKRSLSMMLQEPQNRVSFDPASLVVRQLEVFEQNKLQWNGQVWPGQQMQWTIQLEHAVHAIHNEREAYTAVHDGKPAIHSSLSLDLPNLGRVTANLQMHEGRLRIQIEADEAEAAGQLRNEARALAEALQKHGQQLESLLVKQHEPA